MTVGTTDLPSRGFAATPSERDDHATVTRETRDPEDRVRALLDAAPQAIFIQVDGRFAYVNEAVCRLVGVDRAEQLVGQPVLDRVYPDFHTIVQDRIRALNERRAPVPGVEEAWLRADGTSVPVLVSAAPITYDGHAGAVVFLLDLSEQKRAEQERLRLVEQVQTGQRLESIGRLAGGIAHDFNNLLTVINGYSGMLLSDLGPAHPLRDRIEEIETAGQRAAGLVRQLLAFSRQQVLQPVALDLNTSTTDVETLLQRLLGADVTIETRLAAGLPRVLADPHQVGQVLLNLAVNAREAMPEGGRLVIATSHADGQVCLELTDDGVGMDEPTRRRVFDPFFTTKEVGQGPGLGLAAVHGIVTQAGGTIDVESAPGKGTTFRVRLPAMAEGAAAPTEDPARVDARGQATILLVEDQAEVRRFVGSVLRACGYRVLEAEEPCAACELFEREGAAIDLLLSDVIMPGMSGGDLAAWMRAWRPDLPLMFMSGYAGGALHAHGAGIADAPFLQKPFTPFQLAAAVRAALRPAGNASARVLVVDDEDQVRGYLREVLEREGFVVREAADGREALRAVEAGPVDLVVLDLVMPEQEGLETLRMLRRDAPGLGVIAISGAEGGLYLPAARLLGADATIRKPLRAEELIAEVERVLRARRDVEVRAGAGPGA